MNIWRHPSPPRWIPSRGETVILLAALFFMASDRPEAITSWPMDGGHAPWVGAVLLIAAIVLALSPTRRAIWESME